VTQGVRGAGVAELIDRLLATDLAEIDADGSRYRVALARDDDGTEVLYAPHRETLLLTGQSGGGKSTLSLGLLERISAAGFQWCVLDPEGDYENTEDAVTEGSSANAPEPSQVLDLLRKTDKGVVVNMLAVPIADRPSFLARMLPEILALRAHIGRPHVVLIDEAHHMLPRDWDPGGAAVPVDLEGFLFVTTHPDQVSPRVLDCVNRLLVVGKQADEAVEAFCTVRKAIVPGEVPQVEPGEVLMLDPAQGPPYNQGAVRKLTAIPGSSDRRRHRRKYAEGRLGEDKSFYFRGETGQLNLRAHNLTLFVDLADGVDEATWEWHRQLGHYSQWLRDAVKDNDLADEVAEVERNGASPAEARQQIRAAVEQRYTAPG
jgi:hypothetical protein